MMTEDLEYIRTYIFETTAICYTYQIQKKLLEKRQGSESTSSQATKRADIKIWPRIFFT